MNITLSSRDLKKVTSKFRNVQQRMRQSLLAFIFRKNVAQVSTEKQKKLQQPREYTKLTQSRYFLIIFGGKNKLLVFVSQYFPCYERFLSSA
jgi:NAD kinase